VFLHADRHTELVDIVVGRKRDNFIVTVDPTPLF